MILNYMVVLNKSNIIVIVCKVYFDWLIEVLFNVKIFFIKVLICVEFFKCYNVFLELIFDKRIINIVK